jgi:hypothetical protein
VLGLIREDWSPKQISGYLKKQENIAISHETIYKWIRRDKLNGGELYKHCRHKLKHRKRPIGSAKNIPNRTSRERPREADGSRFGDFEMDTIIGPNHSEAILTITERKTNYLMIKKLPILIVHGKKEQLKTGIKLILGQDTPSPHQVRTKAAPSSLHACIRLASFSHEVRSVRTAVSRFKCGKEAGLFYTGLTESDVVIPALKRRKSEGRAKNNQ